MWFQAFAERQLLGVGWFLGATFVQPWQTLFGSDRRRPERRSRRIKLSRLSREWVRQHEVDAAKHFPPV